MSRVAKESKCSVVILGVDFKQSILAPESYEEWFGALDRDNSIFSPGFVAASYSKCLLQLQSNRIDARMDGDPLIPDALFEGLSPIIKSLEQKDYRATAMGFNCEITILFTDQNELDGKDFCNKVMIGQSFNPDKIFLPDADMPVVWSANAFYGHEGIRMGITFMPSAETDGRDLIVKMNAHQDIGTEDRVSDRFAKAQQVNAYFSRLTESIEKFIDDAE